jgi:two-component system NtrC family sensor kinase
MASLPAVPPARPRPRFSYRHALEDIVAPLSSRFIRLRVRDIDAEIDRALAELGQYLDADRSYVFRFTEDGTLMNNTHEWCAEGVSPQIANLQGLPSAGFPWWFHRLSQFEPIRINRLADLPPEASAERAILAGQDIQSLLVVPIVHGAALTGFLGLDIVNRARDWLDDEVSLLKFVGEIFASALERQRRRRIQTVIYEIGAAALEIDNLETLFDVIRRHMRTVLDTRNFYVALVGHDRNTITFPYYVDENSPGEAPYDPYRIRSIENGLTEYVLNTGKPALLRSDELAALQTSGTVRINGAQPLVWLGAPLRSRDKTIGVIAVQNYQSADAFSSEALALLEFISSQIAVIIERKNLENNLQIVRRLGRELALLLDTEMIIRQVLRIAMQDLPFESIGIGVVNESANLLHYAYQSFHKPNEILRADLPLAGQEPLGIMVSVTRMGTLLNIPDVRQEPRYLNGKYADVEMRSELCAPMTAANRVLGVLNLESRQVNRFTAEDEILLTTLADQTAIALENARLFIESQRQLRELTILQQVSAAGTNIAAEDALIQRVTQIIGEAIYSDNFGVGLLDEEHGGVRVHPSYRGVDQPPDMPIIPLGTGIMGSVAQTGEPALVPDVARDPRFLRIDPDTRSELCVPLKIGDRVIGVLNAESSQPNYFTSADQRLLTTLAGQIASAIENVRLFNAARQRSRELEMVARVSLAVREAASRADIIATLFTQLTELFHIDSGAYTPHDPEQRAFIIEFAAGGWKQLLGVIIPAENSVSADVLASGKMYLLNNLADEPRLQPRFTAGLQTMACIPILAGQQPGGLIWIGRGEPFSAEEARLLGAVGDIAATALQRNALFEDAKRRLAESRMLASISRKLNQTFVLDDILQMIVDSAQELLPYAGRVIFHNYDAQQECLIPVAVSRGGQRGSASLGMRRGQGIAGLALETGAVVRTGDAPHDPRFIFDPNNPIRSLLAVPITMDDRRIGTISIQSERLHAFTPADEILLEELASRAAVAVENARLYQAEYDQRQFAEALARAAAALNRTLHTEEVLDEILQQIRTVIPCRAANIMFIEQDGQARLARHLGYEGLEDVLEQLENLRFPMTWPHFRAMLATRQPIHVPDTRADELYTPTPGADWARSFISVPLQIGSEVIGFLNVSSDEPHYFQPGGPTRLEALAAQAASAINNARLLSSVEDALRQEQAARDKLVQGGKLAALGKMVASVAHELFNPIQTIKNTIFLLRQAIPPYSPDLEFVDIAISELNRVSELVGRLRDTYRPSGNLTLQKVDIVRQLHDVVHLIGPHRERNRVACSLESGVPHCFTPGFPDQLRQVFLNISLNAIEAMEPRGGTLSIRLVEAGQVVKIEFQDTGQGISEEDLPHIFDPFYSSKPTGTGLGLSISYDIVQRHNGEITVISVPGEGTTFTISLPRLPDDLTVEPA